MALGFESKTFRNTFADVKSKLENNEITSRADLDKFLSSKNIDTDEFLSANDEYSTALASGEDLEPGVLATPVRLVGRALGEAGRGATELAEAVLPSEIQATVSVAAESLGEYLPQSVKNNIDEFFDPYHGEGLGIEEGLGTVGGYLIGGGLALKGLSLGAKALNTGIRAASPGVRAAQRRTLVNMERAARKNKAASLLRGTSQTALKAGAFGAGVAAVEKPEDNIVNVITEIFPESEKYLQELAVNPDDSFVEQKVQQFINNAGFGTLLAPATLALGYAAKGVGEVAGFAGKQIVQQSKAVANHTGIADYIPDGIKNSADFLRVNLTANRGTDQAMRQAAITRNKAMEAELTEHAQLAKELQSTVKKNFKTYDADVEETLNKAFDGSLSKKELNNFKNNAPETFDLIEKMRNNRTAMQRKLYQYDKNKLVDEYIAEGYSEQEAKKLAATQARVTGEFKNIMQGSEGVYVTKTYKVKDDPTFRFKRKAAWNKYKRTGKDPEGIFAAAREAVKKTTDNVTDEQADKFIDDMLTGTKRKNEQATDFVDGLLEQTNRLSTARATAKRKLTDDQQAIKVLLGEETDLSKNYLQTMAKLAEMNAERRYLQDVAEHLVRRGGLEETVDTVNLGQVADERIQKIFGKRYQDENQIKKNIIAKTESEGKKITEAQALKRARAAADKQRKTFVNPLEGVYASKEYADFLESGLNHYQHTSPIMNMFLRGKGLSQASATILNVPTHFVNMMGNVMLMGANGMFTPKNYFSAMKSAGSKLSGLSNDELAKRYKRYLELGIANSGVNVNTIRANFDDLATDPETFMRKLTNFTVKGKDNKDVLVDTTKAVLAPVRVVKAGFRKTAELYQLEDDLFKIAHFENTIDYLKKTNKFKGKNFNDPKVRNELELAAAQRTQDLMPNYALVPNAIKSLRYGGLGDFMSFPAEMTRISKNLIKYTIDDITSGDEVLFKEGAKRLAGMTAAGVGTTALSEYSGLINGVTKEQQDALDIVDAPYNYKTDKLYLSPVSRDQNGKLGADVFYMSRLDPFNYVKAAGKTAHRLILDDKEYNDLEQSKFTLGMLDQVAGPFLSPSMITDAAMGVWSDLSGNSYTPKNPDGFEQAKGIMKPLLDVITPGTLKLLQKRAQYEEQLEALEGTGKAPIKKGGLAFKEGEVDALAFMGLKRGRIDLQGATPFVLRDSFNKIKRSDAFLNTFIRENPNLLPTQENQDKIFDLYLTGQQSRLDGYMEVKALVDTYKTLYNGDDNVTAELIYEALSRQGKKTPDPQELEILSHVINNTFVPTIFDEGDFQKLEYSPPIPRRRIYDAYKAMKGSKLYQEEE